MAAKRRSEMARQYAFKSWRDITPMHVSVGTVLHNKTGSWRSIKPIYEDKTPACQNACPVGNDIDGWLRLLDKEEYEKAYWHLKREEPFPAILGRVCFRFCEKACNRAAFDESISVNALERFLSEQVPPSAPHPETAPDNGKRLAIVGSGPAGMSAAYFARLLGFDVTIFEKHPVLGGMLRVGIPAYRLPREIVEAEFEGLAAMGIRLRPNTEIGKDIHLDGLLSEFDYVFAATGAHLSLPFEGNSPHVMSGLTLLRMVALGEDVALGSRVVVIGGGNTAIDAARTAARLGCQVTVLYRRSEAEMPAHPEEVAEAREEGVAFRFLATPEEILLGDDGAIEALVCSEMVLGEPDASGRRRPVKKDGATFRMEADTILSAIGETAEFGYLSDPPRGAIATDEALCVQPGGKLYAGGDILDFPRTVAHAVASGKRAAIAIDCARRGVDFSTELARIAIGNGLALSFAKYTGWSPPVRRNDREVVGSSDIVFDYFLKEPRIEEPIPAGSIRKASFAPYRSTLSPEDARDESGRCMHCGRCTECDNCLIFCPEVSVLDQTGESFGYAIDYDYCKGCGICATECPRHAITMVGEGTEEEEAQ